MQLIKTVFYNMRLAAWIVFALLAITVGLYPLLYLAVFDENTGLMSTKPATLLSNPIWRGAFYLHIFFGGIALLTGWLQFSKRLRTKRLQLHRNLGKVYVGAVMVSGLTSLYAAAYSTGGWITHLGFGFMGLFWTGTTLVAFLRIRNKEIASHQRWMIRSYALCFAAVTFRIYLPLLADVAALGFDTAYKITSWLCWVPNLLIAQLIISKTQKLEKLASRVRPSFS